MSGIIVTIAGPSGSGKTTLEKMLVQELGVARLTSITTRSPRSGEKHGVDYDFLSESEFAKLLDSGQLVDASTNRGKSYGITQTEVESKFAADLPTIVVVNPHGVHQIREHASKMGWHHFAVFLDNHPQELIRRFINRECEGDFDKDRIARGFDTLLNEELFWRNEFPWDMVVHPFNQKTQDGIVDAIGKEIAALKLK